MTLTVDQTGTLVPAPRTGGSGVEVAYEYVSSAYAVASVNASGVVTALAPGSVTVTVTATGTGSGFETITLSTSASITVTAKPPAITGTLSVTPPFASIAAGQTVTLLSTTSGVGVGVQVAYEYRSSDPSVATVSAAGVVTGVKPGSAEIDVTATGTGAAYTQTVRAGKVIVTVTDPTSAISTDLTVSPSPLSLLVGNTVTLTASVTRAHPSVQVQYSYQVIPSAVATVTSLGLVTAVTPGSATVRVTAIGSGAGYTTATRTVDVPLVVSPIPEAIGALTVSPTSASLVPQQTVELIPSVANQGNGVTVSYSYQTGSTAIATVSQNGQKGVVTAVSRGSTSVTVTANAFGNGYASVSRTAVAMITVVDGPPALTGLTVSPTSATMDIRDNLTITPTPQVGGAAVTVDYRYESSSPGIAQVTATGFVTALTPGQATITVTATGSGFGFTTTQLARTTSISVNDSIPALTSVRINPNVGSVPVNQTLALTPIPTTASVGVSVSYQWESSNTNVATVTPQGVVRGVAAGNATITVRATGTGASFATSTRTATASINVTP